MVSSQLATSLGRGGHLNERVSSSGSCSCDMRATVGQEILTTWRLWPACKKAQPSPLISHIYYDVCPCTVCFTDSKCQPSMFLGLSMGWQMLCPGIELIK